MAMTISKAAHAAGVGVETVRFYERKGLIEQPQKRPGGVIRTYPPETIQRIRFIRQAQALGFSLREIDELLSLRADPGADASEVRARATAKLEDVKDRIDRLQRIRRALEVVISACPGQGELGRCSIMEVLERHSATPGEDQCDKRKKERV